MRHLTAGIKLRPRSSLYTQGMIAIVAFMTPVFIVLYVMTVPTGRWPAVLAVQVVATVATTLASMGYFGVGIWVTPGGITERGFFGRLTHFPLDQIGSVIRADTFDGSSTRTLPQLFVCDPEGRQLVRMRGQFWSAESMDTVMSTLEVHTSRITEVQSITELGTRYPGLLYWFERRKLVAAAVVALAAGALALLVFVALVLAGIAIGA